MKLGDVEWIVFDVDGVLIDVTESFDAAVKITVEEISGTDVQKSTVRDLRVKGSFVDDFRLAEALILGLKRWREEELVENFPEGENLQYFRRKTGDSLDQNHVREVFNSFYLGKQGGYPGRGLWRREKSRVTPEILGKLEEEFSLGVITGRNQLELELAEKVIGYCFKNVVTRDQCEKPDPGALESVVGKSSGIFFGDSMNDRKLVENYSQQYGGFGFQQVYRSTELVDILESLVEARNLPRLSQSCLKQILPEIEM